MRVGLEAKERVRVGLEAKAKTRAAAMGGVGLTPHLSKGTLRLGSRSPLGRFAWERRGQEERTIVTSVPTLPDGLPGSANSCLSRNVADEVREPWMTVGMNGKVISVLDGWNPQITCKQVKIARCRNATFAPPPLFIVGYICPAP